MDVLIGFICGLFVGTGVGVFIIALLSANSRAKENDYE